MTTPLTLRALPTRLTTRSIAREGGGRWLDRNFELIEAVAHSGNGVVDFGTQAQFGSTRISEGWVPIAPSVLKELMRFRNLSPYDDIIPGRTATERKDAVDRRHSPWVGQWIKDRSKTSYELRRYAGSLVYNATRDILKVRDFLRHASVETTQQWYADLLKDVPAIGMDDFVLALRAADPRRS
jgi:integrase